jgi:hypothetical protein
MYAHSPCVIVTTQGVRSNLPESEIATPFGLAMTEKIAQFRLISLLACDTAVRVETGLGADIA